MKTRWFLFWIFVYTANQYSFSQEQIKIILINKNDSLKRVEFATLYNVNSNYRSLTDKNGEALIEGQRSDSLQISSLGYHSKLLTIADIGSRHIIFLEPVSYLLSEINIRPRPEIKKLLSKCKINLEPLMGSKPYEQRAFLKERIYESNNVVGYFDGLINIYNGGYSKKYGQEALRYLSTDLINVTDFRRSQYPSYFEINRQTGRYVRINIPNIGMLLYNKKEYLHRRLFTSEFYKIFDFTYENEMLENSEGEYLYKINFKLKEGDKKKLILDYSKNKSNYLFSGYLLINSTDSSLTSFHIDQNDYQKVILNKNQKNATICFTVNYIKLNNRYFLNNIVQESNYEINGVSFRVSDEMNIIDEKEEEMSETQINSRYGKTEMFKGIRIQNQYLVPNSYNDTKWDGYEFLLTNKITEDLERKYKEKLSIQFQKQRLIYTNINN